MSHSDNSNGPGWTGWSGGWTEWDWRLVLSHLNADVLFLAGLTFARSLVQNRIKTHPDPIGNGWSRSTPNAESELICRGGRTYNILKIAMNLASLLPTSPPHALEWKVNKRRNGGVHQPHVQRGKWMNADDNIQIAWPSRRRVLLINWRGFCSHWPRSLHKY